MKTTEMHVFCSDDESDTDDNETIRHIQFVQRVLEQELRNNHLLITKWNQEESQQGGHENETYILDWRSRYCFLLPLQNFDRQNLQKW